MNYRFDWNEWFFILSIIVIIIIIIMLPKRFKPMVVYLNWLFVIIYIETIDYALGVIPHDLYDFLDGPGYQPTVAVAHFLLYPGFAYLFLYFYDKWKLSGSKLVLYILGWTIFAVLYEWVSTLNNVLTYKGWHLLYSIPTYPISCIIIIFVFHCIRKNYNNLN